LIRAVLTAAMASTAVAVSRRPVTLVEPRFDEATLDPMAIVHAPVTTDPATVAVRALAPLLGVGVVSAADSTGGLVQRVLALARVHLGLEVSYFSRFEDGMQVFEDVSGDSDPFYIAPGLRTPLDVTYCSKVLGGEIPNIIPDTRADPRTSDLPVTQLTGIGAYAGVPVMLPDGEVYGMLCCIGSEAQNEIDAGDVRFMRVLADLLSEEVLRRRPLDDERAAIGARIDHAISGGGLRMVYQPIVRLDSLEMVGVEALSRFEGGPPTPDKWFHEAAGIGRGVELELASLRLASASMPRLPVGAYMSLNASPELITRFGDRELPVDLVCDRVLLEITEHARIDDYAVLLEALAPLRARGMRIAIDDAGAGYSSFRHILLIKPDVIKLDISIVRDIDKDSSRRALAAALISFSAEINANLVAEGVETEGEREALQRLGATLGQGYLFARPGPLPPTGDQPAVMSTTATMAAATPTI
jgi:EAL domain-containing protein (putative c-di-GMP-specific phosphodiesterase class I)